VADAKYNSTKRARRQTLWCPRLFLHAARLQLDDMDGQALDVSAPLPSDLASVLDCMTDVEE
jgi:23S rRNA-/tRNA-specific pseudouridylate synthase